MKRQEIRDSVKEALREPSRAFDLIMRVIDKLLSEIDSNEAEQHLRWLREAREYYVPKLEEAVRAEKARCAKVLAEKIKEIEELTLNNRKIQEQSMKVAEENNELRAMNEDLKFENITLKRQCKQLTADKVKLVSERAQTQEQYDALVQENGELKMVASHLQEQLELRNRDVFGAQTEQTYRIFSESRELENLEDLLREDAPFEDDDKEAEKAKEAMGADKYGEEKLPKSRSAKRATDLLNGMIGEESDEATEEATDGTETEAKVCESRKTRKKGDIKERYTKLKHVKYCPYTDEMFDKMFGVGRWRIPFRIVKMKLCETRPVVYVRDEYSLVLEYIDLETNERKLKHFPCNLNDKSLASSSIMASVATKVYDLSLPYNRIERSYKSRDAELDKQLQNNWLLNFTDTTEGKKSVGTLVWEKLKQEQLKYPVHQIDETTWPVVLWKDKANGSRAYIWQHVTSELINGHKIVLYKFTDTRSADHLRQYLANLANYIVIVSDAYGAYPVVEKELNGKMKVAFCWMHLRRYFANAVLVTDLDELKSKEEILSNPAVKGLLLANKIFEKERHLKQLSADQRKARRLEEVKPCVDEFFELVHSQDIEKLGDCKLKDAIVYARNGEEHLRIFFENENIPIDNGECERRMKPLAILRKNAMFSYTSRGRGDCYYVLINRDCQG